MSAHIIFENEITSCQEAAGLLLSNEGDPRTNYQKIFHILEGCKDRFPDTGMYAPDSGKGEFPTTLKELQVELLEHAKIGRGGVGDSDFRLGIFIDNLGSAIRHHTHDPTLNPTSRLHGTPASRVADAGHAIVQLLTLMAVEGVDLQEAVNAALPNLRGKDFMKSAVPDGDTISGTIACHGWTRGEVWKISPTKPDWFPAEPKKFILVASHLTSDSRISKFAGIITDNGSFGCHAGIIAREAGIPCLVGTGNATRVLKEFDLVELDCNGNAAVVKKVPKEPGENLP